MLQTIILVYSPTSAGIKPADGGVAVTHLVRCLVSVCLDAER